MGKLGNGNAMGVSMYIGVRLGSKSSFCAPVENGNGRDGYSPRDFACPSEGWKNCEVHVQLVGQLLWARIGQISLEYSEYWIGQSNRSTWARVNGCEFSW